MQSYMRIILHLELFLLSVLEKVHPLKSVPSINWLPHGSLTLLASALIRPHCASRINISAHGEFTISLPMSLEIKITSTSNADPPSAPDLFGTSHEEIDEEEGAPREPPLVEYFLDKVNRILLESVCHNGNLTNAYSTLFSSDSYIFISARMT